MTQGIPKSARDLLAQQTPPDQHPSADLLNAYVEHSLTAGENSRVVKHLAACAGCREVVFLASVAVEEERELAVAAAAPQRQEFAAVLTTVPAPKRKWMWWKWAVPAVAVVIVAAGLFIEQNRTPERAHPMSETLALNYPASSAATPNRDNALVLYPPAAPATKASQATPAESKKHPAAGTRWNEAFPQARRNEQEQALQRSRELAQLSSSLEKPRANGVGGAIAAMPAAAGANLVSGDFTGTVVDPSGAVVSNATVTLRNNVTGQTRSTTTNSSGAYRFSLLQPGSYTVSASASGFSKAETTAVINGGQATVGDVKLAVGSSSQTVEVTSAAPLVQADNAELSTNFGQNVVANAPSGGNDLTYTQKPSAALKSGVASSNQAASTGLVSHKVIPLQWRITADGHLERAQSGGNWTPVLADQPVAFRVVATVGDNVWAGGNHGALFHSTDRGQSWNKVTLGAKGQPEPGAIISIHFDNLSQGIVSADSGTTWSTSDGGHTWIKQ